MWIDNTNYPEWNPPFDTLWISGHKLNFDNYEIKSRFEFNMDQFRASNNSKSKIITEIKRLMYENFCVYIFIDNRSDDIEIEIEPESYWEPVEGIVIPDELIDIFEAHHASDNLKTSELIQTATDNLNNALGDWLTKFWLILEKKYIIEEYYELENTYRVYPWLRILDVDKFVNFLNEIKESDSALDRTLSLILAWTYEWIEQAIDDWFPINNEYDYLKQFLIDFQKVTDRLSRIKHFNPESYYWVKDYSKAYCDWYLEQYIQFSELWFVGNLDEIILDAEENIPVFLDDLMCSIKSYDDYKDEDEWIDDLIEEFKNCTNEALELLLLTTNSPYLREKMWDELLLWLTILQKCLSDKDCSLPDNQKEYIEDLVKKFHSQLSKLIRS